MALIGRGWQLRVSVVSAAAARAYPNHPKLEIQIGALGNNGELKLALEQWPCRWVIDATHPFARHIHQQQTKPAANYTSHCCAIGGRSWHKERQKFCPILPP